MLPILTDIAVNVLRVLTAKEMQTMSTVTISKKINADVYDLAEIIKN